MKTRLTIIFGLALVGIAVVIVLSKVREEPDASMGGTGNHGTANPKRPILDPATSRPTKLPRSSQRASAEELIQKAELHYAAKNYEAALEVGMLAVDRAPNEESTLPPHLRALLRLLQGEPQYIGKILNVENDSSGDIYMSTELTPEIKYTTSRPLYADQASFTPEVIIMSVPSSIIVRGSSVKNIGDFRKGDVVKVWAGALLASLPMQVDALRIQKVE